MRSPGALRCRAPAKVNLYLRVLGKRSDGYHEIETIFQAVSLFDDLTLALTADGQVDLEVVGADLGPPASNLAYVAARNVLDAAGSTTGIRIRLDKHIPVGSGLGGGSSDAAATLRCTNALLGRPLAVDDVRRIAAELGSDVPFFLGPGTLAMGRGRGERLEALPPLPEAHLVLVLPPVRVNTGRAYRALAEHREGGGEAPCLGLGGDAPADWKEVADLAANDFDVVTTAAHPEVAQSLHALREAGASPALLSGSGSACFGIFADAGAAARAARVLSGNLPWPAVVAHTLSEWPGTEPLAGAAGVRDPRSP